MFDCGQLIYYYYYYYTAAAAAAATTTTTTGGVRGRRPFVLAASGWGVGGL